MRQLRTLVGLPLFALAACTGKVDVSDSGNSSAGDNVQLTMSDTKDGRSAVSVKVPGFDANVSLPKLDLGSHVDMDGIKLAPDTKIGGLDVNALTGADGTGGEGKVRLNFTNRQPPAALIEHYARSAANAGYAIGTRTASALNANKADKIFAVQVSPDGSGSRGTITIGGKDSE